MEQSDEDRTPDWWRTNDRLRAEMGLPPYEPPRFADGVPTFEVTDDLEAAYDCTIRFEGRNTRYPDDFVVSLDGTPVTRIGRHRDENANTVYEMDSATFREVVERAVEERQ